MITEFMFRVIKNGVSFEKFQNLFGEKSLCYDTYLKYQKIPLEEGLEYIKNHKRISDFDNCYDYIIIRLRQYPKLQCTRLFKEIQDLFPEITCGLRALQKYVKPIRKAFKKQKGRIYRMIMADAQDVQVQVDLGEYVVPIGNTRKRIYFVVFVFSYSRMMYVSFQDRPYNTEDFIRAHEESFKYFNGVGKEYVYDQTKLVVIQEKFGETKLNDVFNQFSIKSGFKIKICHAYDPESKGKVERMVQYIKNGFLYGQKFTDINDLKQKCIIWLKERAETRIHGATKQQPAEMFLEEKQFLLKTYFYLQEANIRTVDKTCMIMYKTNKYSVPSEYQYLKVMLNEVDSELHIYDSKTIQMIAKHTLAQGNNQIVIDLKHFPDKAEQTKRKTEEIMAVLSNILGSEEIVNRIISDNPGIERSQLEGLRLLRKDYPPECWEYHMPVIKELPKIQVSVLKKILKKGQFKMVTSGMPEVTTGHVSDCSTQQSKISSSCLDRPLNTYMKGVKNVKNNDNKFEKK